MQDRRNFLLATGAALVAPTLPVMGSPAPESTKQIRLGVVGGGFGATFHFHEHPNCVVAGVTDLRADRRSLLRNHYRCDSLFDSLEEMLRQAEKFDAIAI